MRIEGWIEDIRDLGKIKFIILHTPHGDYQITCKKDILENFEILKILTLQSAIRVEGEEVKEPVSKLKREILAKKIEIVALAPNILPINPADKVSYDLDKKLNYRFLDFRNHKTLSIIKIQNTIIKSFREFCEKNGFIEIFPPLIIESSTEGGSELFEVKYFEKKAYLAQSPQLYKQMAAISLGKVFCISPIFRAEKFNTLYHLNQAISLDVEIAFSDYNEAMKYLEDFFILTLEKIVSENYSELIELNTKVDIPQKIERVKYEEIVEELKLNFGDDIKREHEEKICEIFGEAVFIIDFPLALRPFYTMPKDDGKTSKSFDLIYRGLELASGAQRIHIPELLEKRIKECNLNVEDFKEYIEAFKYGAPPHSGWALGLERFTMKICNLKNIREASMWPRDRFRLRP
jgi:aspartyl-tRNA synthetase